MSMNETDPAPRGRGSDRPERGRPEGETPSGGGVADEAAAAVEDVAEQILDVEVPPRTSSRSADRA